MAYTKHTWATGETITAANLNNMEDGISNAALAEDVSPLLTESGGGHNYIYRGKALGSSVTDEQYASISAGTFEDLYIGDYWKIDSVKWRIAAFCYYYLKGDTKCSSQHVVIVPDSSLYSLAMNSTSTTEGGYVGSEMYTSGLEDAKTTIKNIFGDHVLTKRCYLTNAVSNGYPSACAWYDSEVELLNEQMVYGGAILGPGSTGTVTPRNSMIETSQLPLFRYAPWRIHSSNGSYWLRDVVSATSFAVVISQGNSGYYGATNAHGVRPVFCIS